MTDKIDHIKGEMGAIRKDDPDLLGFKSLKPAAAPLFTFTLVNNETYETVIKGDCNGWQIHDGELDCSLELPDILITIAPKGPPGMEDKDNGTDNLSNTFLCPKCFQKVVKAAFGENVTGTDRLHVDKEIQPKRGW